MINSTLKLPALLIASASAAVMLAFPAAGHAAVDNYHFCGVLTSGKVNCWGLNSSGQLGNNSSTDSKVPVEVSGITSAVQVSAGGQYSCAVLPAGKVNCWGLNTIGQLGDSSNTDSKVPVEVSGITNASQVSAGSAYACAVLSSGKVNCWGNNSAGMLGNNSSSSSNVPVEVSGITSAVQVSASFNHSCAALTSGKVNCWGSNIFGMLGNNTTIGSRIPVEVSGITSAVQVSVGYSHSCAVLSTGKVNCWGYNANGQLGNNSTTRSNVPVEVSGITDAVQVAVGASFSCALLSSGKVNCWGLNISGQLGNNSTIDSKVPVEVSGITSGVQVAVGYYSVCALLSSGKGNCWGRNSKITDATQLTGQLGSASTGPAGSLVPVEVSNVSSFVAFEFAAAPADTTAPATPGSFTGVPSSPTSLTGATIGFTLGESGGTVECRLDSGSWGACTSVSGTTGSQTVSGLADGSHTLSVRQADGAGNVSEVGTSSAWTVDTTSPAAPLLSGAPSGSTTSTSTTISFTGEAGATFICSLDGGAYSDCTSPSSLSGMLLGSHTFAVKATDAAGNTSDAGSVSWRVVEPPILPPTILTPPADTKTVAKATVGGKGTWVMKLGLLFSTGGDTRGGAQILTVQVAVDSAGRPVSTRPSDSQPLPTAAKFTQGIVAWDASGEMPRATINAPVWVRVGNRVGKWSGWAKLTK